MGRHKYRWIMSLTLKSYLVSQSRYSSREILTLLKAGKITINGKRTDKLMQLIHAKRDHVCVDGNRIIGSGELFYFKFFKPKNMISTLQDSRGRQDLSNIRQQMHSTVFPVGRLDRQSTGLLLFTNDGELANRILHPKYELSKTYRVSLESTITGADIKRLEDGFILEDGPVQFTQVYLVDKNIVSVTLYEGRNRIVRRSFAYLGYTVKGLKRVSIGPIELGALALGKWQKMTPRELRAIKKDLKL